VGKAGFGVNYLFEVESNVFIQCEDGSLILFKDFEDEDFEDNAFTQPKDNSLTLLHLAVYNNLGNTINALLKAEGINVNAVHTSYLRTPLYCAARNGRTKIVNTLVENEVNVNAEDENRFTPLHLAAYHGHTEVVKILIANGADPLLKIKDKTPRDLAERDFIKKLLKEAEEKQLKQQALNKSISAGGATALLGSAVAVALFVTGTVAVEL
jgi:ankyrin repeat protein